MSAWVLLAGRRAHWGLNWELYRLRRSSASSSGWSSWGAVPWTRASRASARARSVASRRRRSARSWSRDGGLGEKSQVRKLMAPGGPTLPPRRSCHLEPCSGHALVCEAWGWEAGFMLRTRIWDSRYPPLHKQSGAPSRSRKPTVLRCDNEHTQGLSLPFCGRPTAQGLVLLGTRTCSGPMALKLWTPESFTF